MKCAHFLNNEDRTVRLLDAYDEDEEKTANERGGDIKLLRLHDNPTMDETTPSRPQTRNLDGSTNSSSSFHSLLMGSSASSLSRITVPLDHPSRKHFLKIDANADAEAFMDSRACKPAGTSKNIFGTCSHFEPLPVLPAHSWDNIFYQIFGMITY